MHDTLSRLHGGKAQGKRARAEKDGTSGGGRGHQGHGGQGQRGTGGRGGTTIHRFRLNEAVSQIAFGGRRGQVYRRIVALAGVRPGDSVLDVGCSGGYLARKLAAATGPSGHVAGVDPSEAAIAYAGRRAAHAQATGVPASGTMTFAVGVAQRLDFPDSSFDVVTCTLAMHHVPARKRETAVREMYRVTRPGGRLLIADFDPGRVPLPLHRGSDKMRRAAASVGPLEDLARAAGYEIESRGDLPMLRYIVAVRPDTGAKAAVSDEALAGETVT